MKNSLAILFLGLAILIFGIVAGHSSIPPTYLTQTESDELENNDWFFDADPSIEAGLCTSSPKPFRFVRVHGLNTNELEATELSVKVGSCNGNYYYLQSEELTAGVWQVKGPEGRIKLTNPVSLINPQLSNGVNLIFSISLGLLIITGAIIALVGFFLVYKNY